MKLAILGTGMIVHDLMNTIHDLDLERVDILSTQSSYDQAIELVREYHLNDVYVDYDQLLEGECDTVYIALPNFLHYQFAKKALLHNKNLIIEKPITSTYEELKELEELADNKHLIILEAVTVHAMPAYLSLKEKIKTLGDIKILSLNYSQYSSRYDAFKQGKILPAFDYHKSGGALYDLNIYNVHFTVGLFGKPNKVFYYPNMERNIDTSGILILEYSHFKAVLIGAKDCQAPLMNTIQGDKGHIVIRMPVSRMRDYQITYNKEKTEDFSFDNNAHGMSYEFKEFIRIIDTKDYRKAHDLFEISKIVSEVLNQARKTGGIRFDADK